MSWSDDRSRDRITGGGDLAAVLFMSLLLINPGIYVAPTPHQLQLTGAFPLAGHVGRDTV